MYAIRSYYGIIAHIRGSRRAVSDYRERTRAYRPELFDMVHVRRVLLVIDVEIGAHGFLEVAQGRVAAGVDHPFHRLVDFRSYNFV